MESHENRALKPSHKISGYVAKRLIIGLSFIMDDKLVSHLRFTSPVLVLCFSQYRLSEIFFLSTPLIKAINASKVLSSN